MAGVNSRVNINGEVYQILIEIIIRYYREGKRARTISRDSGLSRKTVSKYISPYESALAHAGRCC